MDQGLPGDRGDRGDGVKLENHGSKTIGVIKRWGKTGKMIGVKVSWDDFPFPIFLESQKNHVPTSHGF